MNPTLMEDLVTRKENDTDCSKNKRISDIIDLWKFSRHYSEEAQVTEDGLLSLSPGKAFKVDFIDISLNKHHKSEVINNMCQDIVSTLQLTSDYYVELHKHHNNYTTTEITSTRCEILDAINGKLVFYKHVKQIIKLAGSANNATIRINFNVKDCRRNDITTILRTVKDVATSGKWMVLVLDRTFNRCDAVNFPDDVFTLPYECDYEKLFIFHFYNGKCTELPTIQ